MTKEITKAYILQEMEDKFKLREFAPEPFTFSETVIPVYNIEQHLESNITKFASVSITSAAAFNLLFVPETERWRLRRYDVVFMASGAYKVSGIFVTRKGQSQVYLDLTKGQTDSYHVDLIEPVALGGGDAISILIDDYTSTADLRLYVDYVQETVR